MSWPIKPFQGQMKGAPVIQLYISHIHFLNYVFVLWMSEIHSWKCFIYLYCIVFIIPQVFPTVFPSTLAVVQQPVSSNVISNYINIISLDFLLEWILLHLQMRVSRENSHNLQQIECTWPRRPLVVARCPSFSPPSTRCRFCLPKHLCWDIAEKIQVFVFFLSWRPNSKTMPTKPWWNVRSLSDALWNFPAATSWSHSGTVLPQVWLTEPQIQKNLFRKIPVQVGKCGRVLNHHKRAPCALKRNDLLLTNYILILFIFAGIASTPVTPLLSSILQKGRNHFVITDNGPWCVAAS